MGKEMKDKVSNKVSSEIRNIAKELLDIIESSMYGRLREASESREETSRREEIIREEFGFMRNKILDVVNNANRVVVAVLNKVDISEKDGMTIRVNP